MAIPKPDQKLMIYEFHDLYNFRTDDERIDHNDDNEVHIDNAEPAEEAYGGGMLETSKKVSVSNKRLGKSGKGSGWLVNESEKKGKTNMGVQQEQVSVEGCFAVSHMLRFTQTLFLFPTLTPL